MNPELLAQIKSADWLEALRRRLQEVREAVEGVSAQLVGGVRFHVGGVAVRAEWAADLASVTIGPAAELDATSDDQYRFIVPIDWVTNQFSEPGVVDILAVG